MPRSVGRHLGRHLGHLAAAAAVLAVPACTGIGAGPAPKPATAPPAAPLAGPGSIVVARCDRFAAESDTPGTKDHRVTVTAYAAADGARIDGRTTVLPDGAVVEPLCGQPRDSSAEADRQLFDTGFSRIAGTLPGPGGSGTVATAFSLTDGSPAAGPAVEGHAPAFQAGTALLWYESADRRLAARDLAHPEAAPTAHGAAVGADFTLTGGQAWPTRPFDSTPDQVVPAPDGTAAAGSGPTLWQRGDVAAYDARYVEPATLGPNGNGRAVVPGSESVPRCSPRLWTDPATLLCMSRDDLLLIHFTAGHAAVDGVTGLLPRDPYRHLDSVVAAPDGRSLAYLAAESGTTSTLYRVGLDTGSLPVRIGRLDAPDAAPQTAGTTHLVGWQ
ncbi:hypothetical protein AB0D08_34930 [Kitasatospora sp. NPDC048540]|uniref:hypothetical protein n=1 Tax=unclassified Kitasatospora TaxID=2633591 RepID=UPI00053B645F|nr:hypothetical protein [Kitasatospora sp. MBT63]